MNHIINTPCGKIQGIIDKNIISYKGIRYAKANRFEYPTIIKSWEGIYDASKYGNCCYQPRSFYNEEEMPKKVFYYNEFRKNEKYDYSEDCLFLNIWTPENVDSTSKLPVLIYIHGGGFTGGCGHEKHFDGPLWPTKGIIGVTINYRLGPLGFSSFKEAKEKDGHTGNYGLFDQLTAIKWIKNNIASFGGDPENITIMGQSAGAMSVQHLSLSKEAKGLFNKAIMSSGGGTSDMLPRKQHEKTYYFWEKVIEFAGCSSFEEFKNIPIETLFSAWNKARREVKGAFSATSPVIDGKLIKGSFKKELSDDSYKKIAYMIGSTSEDIIPPILNNMALSWCKKQEKPAYCWMFNHQLPNDNNGAWHSSDLWYWFGTLNNCWRSKKEFDYKLSDTMITYLTNFVKSGNPNGDNVPEWKEANKSSNNVMHLGNNTINMHKTNKIKLWFNMFTNKQVGE